MREKVAAVEIALCEHAGHALNRREIQIAIAVNDADLGAYDLEEPGDGVKWRPEVPRSVDQGRIIHLSALDRSLSGRPLSPAGVKAFADPEMILIAEMNGENAGRGSVAAEFR